MNYLSSGPFFASQQFLHTMAFICKMRSRSGGSTSALQSKLFKW